MQRALTVGELLASLRVFPAEMPVVALYDCRMAEGNVVRVELGSGPDDDCESVVLTVE